MLRTLRARITVADDVFEIDAFDGQQRIILHSTAPIADDAGHINGAAVVNQDVTEHHHALETLEHSRSL